MGCGGSKDKKGGGQFSEAYLAEELKKRGITDERISHGLFLAFDKDKDGSLDEKEIANMLTYLDEENAKPKEEDPVPWDCKAVAALAQTKAGPTKDPGNPKLKMILSSAGLMPGSSGSQIKAVKDMKANTPGKGVIYLIDARLPTLQFRLHNADPSKHGRQKRVAYRREPDTPDGFPVKGKDGQVELKSEEELDKDGHAGVAYVLRTHGHYANGHLKVLAGDDDGEVPVYVAYLWYTGEIETKGKKKGDYKHTIMVAKGVYRDGQFIGLSSKDGSEFKDADYGTPSNYGDDADHWFKTQTDAEFTDLFNNVQVVYGCGGAPTLPILHFQPDFIDETGKFPKKPNAFGLAILDNVKSGKVVYVGTSAGSMVWGWSLGPLSTDPHTFMLNADGESKEDDKVDMGPQAELSRLWLFPGLGQYVNIPYDMTVKAHVQFNPATCSFGGTAAKAENAAKVCSAVAKTDKYVALLTDYDWYAGQGDCLEISDGKVWYHAGFCDRVDSLPEQWQDKLKELGFADQGDTIPRQPPGVPKDGIRFEWKPAIGELVCAGPQKKGDFTFRMYADSKGPLEDAHPAYQAHGVVDTFKVREVDTEPKSSCC